MSRRRSGPHVLAVARGDEPADLLLTGGRVFLSGTREWLETDLAVADGVIAGFGPREATEVVDVGGTSLTPGFVDPHMHLESTKLWVDEFVRAVLPQGTTAVAADPHEIANVFGVRELPLSPRHRARCRSRSASAHRRAFPPPASRAPQPRSIMPLWRSSSSSTERSESRR